MAAGAVAMAGREFVTLLRAGWERAGWDSDGCDNDAGDNDGGGSDGGDNDGGDNDGGDNEGGGSEGWGVVRVWAAAGRSWRSRRASRTATPMAAVVQAGRIHHGARDWAHVLAGDPGASIGAAFTR